MRSVLVLLIALATIRCQPVPLDAIVEGPTGFQRTFDTATCPEGREATWCLLFSDHSTASISITQTTPKALGYLQIESYKLPLEGDVDDVSGSFSLSTTPTQGWDWLTKATIEGTFAPSATFTTGTLAFFSGAEEVGMFVPEAFPTDVTFDPLRSVTGKWTWYSNSSTEEPTVELVQLNRLLLMFYEQQYQNRRFVTVWPGERTDDLGFSFWPEVYVADGGAWIEGQFSVALTMATARHCHDNITGTVCESKEWLRLKP